MLNFDDRCAQNVVEGLAGIRRCGVCDRPHSNKFAMCPHCFDRIAVIGGRGYGKTTMLLRHVQQNPRSVLMVTNEQAREHAIRTYRIDPSRVVAAREIGRDRWRGARLDVYIDDVESILREEIGPGHVLKGFSMTAHPIALTGDHLE